MSTGRQERVAQALRQLADEEPVCVVVRGDSMLPLLEDGDRVEIVARARYLPGDIVAFRRADQRLCVHRLLGFRPTRGGWRMVTRGDAARALDPPLEPEQVLGRIVGGDCATRAFRVPIRDRAVAIARFCAAAARKLVGS